MPSKDIPFEMVVAGLNQKLKQDNNYVVNEDTGSSKNCNYGPLPEQYEVSFFLCLYIPDIGVGSIVKIRSGITGLSFESAIP